VKVGANGQVDTNTACAPNIGFVVTNAGLMANLSLEGTKSASWIAESQFFFSDCRSSPSVGQST
jgi:lipid-binding SYLF domain-containing protein